jgi:pSer/pThr/pTyr-binding forkhead associated (FHA) protein
VLKLIIEDDEGRKTVVPFARDELTIGRQEGNTIRLTERNVSRRHARLIKQNGHVLIEDLGSYNGIRVNGDRISGQVKIADGDLIQIGDYDLALQFDQAADQVAPTVPLESSAAPRGSGQHRQLEPHKLSHSNAAAPTMPALPAVDAPEAQDNDVQQASADDVSELGPPPRLPKNQSTAVIRLGQVEDASKKRRVTDVDVAEAPRLVLLNTDLAGKEFPCTRTELRIGRTDDNDIAIDHRSLSRTHCKLVREENGEWRIIDLQSANGLMVNGEPYAQVTLSRGDVVELGYVKLKFVGPGEDVAIPATSSSSITQQTEAGSGSKAPLIAVIAAGLCIVLGVGGYAWLKSRQTVTPAHVGRSSKGEPGAKDPGVKPPAKEDPAAARAAVEQKLADARSALSAMDWNTAELLLKDCKLDGALHPEARALLVQMDGERGYKVALEQAAAALDAGDLDKAKTHLDSAMGTRLLKERYDALEARRAEEVKKKLAVATKPPKNDPPPRVDPPKNSEAQTLYDEASSLIKSKNYEAATIRLERCIRVAATFHPCYKLLGSSYARIAARNGSAADLEKARKYYERFIEVAPPDDPDVPKVRQILEQARQTR